MTYKLSKMQDLNLLMQSILITQIGVILLIPAVYTTSILVGFILYLPGAILFMAGLVLTMENVIYLLGGKRVGESMKGIGYFKLIRQKQKYDKIKLQRM